MSNFKIITPVATTNLFLDPQFGASNIATSWSKAGDGVTPTTTRVNTDQWYGPYCCQFGLDSGTYTRLYQASTVTATSYTLSAMVKRAAAGTLTSTQCQAHFNSSDVNWDSITQMADNWYLCVKSGTATAGARNFGVTAKEEGLLCDALQLENLSYRTTYVDGTLVGNRDIVGGTTYGYRWNGTAHASTSTRHALERTGGKVSDMETDLGAIGVDFNGEGMVDYDHILLEYALLPGALYQNTKVKPRQFSLAMSFNGSTPAALHANRLLMLKAISIDSVKPRQPFIFQFNLNERTLQIACLYAGGMNLNRINKTVEQPVMRVMCPDPYWTNIKEETKPLTVNSATDVVYNGTAPGYPILTIVGTGLIQTLTNNTTGDVITFSSLNITSADTVKLDLRIGRKTLTNSAGTNLIAYVQPGQVATWSLLPSATNSITLATGDNILGLEDGTSAILCEDGSYLGIAANNITDCYLSFNEKHESIDGIEA